jgi:hypothetical protein
MKESTGLVDNLVSQFSSAFDCFRELVQNSIDAGSPRVDVWTEFEGGIDHVGTIRLVVEDIGEGMDEAIIDQELTQLFASSKEDDLTKIGKFGIGFVSVFALKPRGVLIHTGRSGEYWEIFFHADRTFTKTRMEDPVEGTRVTIFLEGDYHRYREVTIDVRESLRRWCAHAETEITFEDRTPPPGERVTLETVNEPFESLDAHCVVTHDEAGTELVCGYSRDPAYAFLNAGLTLARTHDPEEVFSPQIAERLRHVSVKVDSRYLEHTLSRDTVMRDENWRRVVETITSVVDTGLPAQLLSEIEALVAEDDWDISTMHRYSTLVNYLAREPDEVIGEVVTRRVFRGVHRDGWTPEQVWHAYRKDGRVLVAEGPSELTRRLSNLGIPVILGKWVRTMEGYESTPAAWSDHPLESVPLMLARCVALRSRKTFWGTVKRFFGVDLAGEVESAIADPQLVYLPVAVDDESPEESRRLLDHAASLLESIGAGYARLGTFVPSATSREVPFFVTGREFAEVMARPPRGFEDRSHAAVNRAHPHFARLVRTYATEPKLAAYCLAKALLLTEYRMLHRDLELIEHVLGR